MSVCINQAGQEFKVDRATGSFSYKAGAPPNVRTGSGTLTITEQGEGFDGSGVDQNGASVQVAVSFEQNRGQVNITGVDFNASFVSAPTEC